MATTTVAYDFVLHHLKTAQFNAVVPSQKEMDRVGVEPTTSAQYSKVAFIFRACPLIGGEDIVNFISRNNI